MEQAGEVARTEARLFRIERGTRLTELAGLESQVRSAELNLKQLMGLSPEAPVVFHASGIGPAVSASSLEPDAGTSPIEECSPLMQVIVAEYEAAEKSLELEVRRQYPDLQIGPGYGNEDGQNELLLGVNLPIPILNGNRRGIAEARAQRDVARAAAEATLEQLVADLHAARIRFDAASQSRLLLIESLTRQHEIKAMLIAAHREESLARIDIQEIAGPPTQNGAGPASDRWPSNHPVNEPPTPHTP